MREEVWLGERGGRVISLRSRVMLGFMMDYVPQLLLHAMAMVDCNKLFIISHHHEKDISVILMGIACKWEHSALI